MLFKLSSLVAAWLVVAPAASASETPLEIMKREDKIHQLALERTDVMMVLQKQGEEKRVRQFELVRVQSDVTGDRQLITFSSPADIKDTALLTVEEKPGGDEDQWLYLPAFRKSRRIGGSELGDRFVGSDYFYEDLRPREVEEYAYKMLGSEKIDGKDCYVIEATPSAAKAKKESPYGKVHIWLQKDILVRLKVRMFDRRMQPFKEFIAADHVKVDGDAWRPDKAVMRDFQRKHQTTLLVKKRQTDEKVSEDTFSQHKLGKR